MLVRVDGNDIDKALRTLRKKMRREGVLRDYELHRVYQKPSEKRNNAHRAAVRRAKKVVAQKTKRDA